MKEIKLSELSFNPFDKLGRQWSLITAGDIEHFNTMTASWGFMGVMWGKDVLNMVVRPTRHTYSFLDMNEFFTVSFFDESHRDALTFCGRNSGRDVDKIAETGLVPAIFDDAVGFDDAELVFVCRKLYKQQMTPDCFVNNAIRDALAGEEEMHAQFIGEIISVYVKGEEEE